MRTSNLITCLFDSLDRAEEAVSHLMQDGFTWNEIAILMKDHHRAEVYYKDISSLATVKNIPGIVSVSGVGLLAGNALASELACEGGQASDLADWIVNIGVSKELAPYYERGLKEGGAMIVIAQNSFPESQIYQILSEKSAIISGGSEEPHIAPEYASRFQKIPSSPRSYDAVNYDAQLVEITQPEMARTVNSIHSEVQENEKT